MMEKGKRIIIGVDENEKIPCEVLFATEVNKRKYVFCTSNIEDDEPEVYAIRYLETENGIESDGAPAEEDWEELSTIFEEWNAKEGNENGPKS
jgi:hypothetical protein